MYIDFFIVSGVVFVLDKNGILLVVRVCFRVVNGCVREGNVFIDSGVIMIVICKDFVVVLGL